MSSVTTNFVHDEGVKASTRQPHFEKYNECNPEVYESFRNFCVWLWEGGIRNYSAQEVFGNIRLLVRLEAELRMKTEQGWRVAPPPTMKNIGVSRSYFVYFARKLEAEDLRFKTFFDHKGGE